MGTGNLMLGAGGGGGVTLQWTSIQWRGELKYSMSLHATETGISFGLYGPLGSTQTFISIHGFPSNFAETQPVNLPRTSEPCFKRALHLTDMRFGIFMEGMVA